jgi:signal transduction histidine kinase
VTDTLTTIAPQLWLDVDQLERTKGRTRKSRKERSQNHALSERARIAREIHDVLARTLGALGVQIEAALSVLVDNGDIAVAIDLLRNASRLNQDGLRETRYAIQGLRIDPPPLPDSLERLATSHRQDYHGPVTVSVIGPARPIRPDANVALFCVAREALTNAARHAPSAAVRVLLAYDAEQVTLAISNPRVPIASASRGRDCTSPTGGYGLAGMRERLELVGGRLAAGPSGDRWIVRAQASL